MPHDEEEPTGTEMESAGTPEPEVQEKPSVDMRELGSTGLRKAGGVVLEELFSELEGERGRRKYQEMGDNDPVLSGILYTFEMLFRQAKMTVRPGHRHHSGMDEDDFFSGEETALNPFDKIENPEEPVEPELDEFGMPIEEVEPEPLDPAKEEEREAREYAEFVESCFYDMSHSFSEFLAQVATKFQYGWDVHEIVYKKREGFDPRNPGKSSRFDDGKIGWRKFAHRDQKSLDEWEFDDKGEIKAFIQYDPYRPPRRGGPGPVKIPIQKLLLFRTTTRANTPEGKSMLRGAYRPWYFKKRIEEIEAIGIERDLAGMPIIYAPLEIFGEEATDAQKALFASLKTAVQNIRRDATDGMVFPLGYDENGNELYRFELASTGGRRQIDTNEIIRRRNMEMAMTVLADFMMLGHESTGSFALSQDKTNLFSLAIDGFLMQVADVLNRHAIPRLMLLNGLPLELAPYVTFDSVRAPTLTEIGEYIQRLARAGAPFFPDDKLQAWLHERGGMPEPIPMSEREVEAPIDDAGGEGMPGGNDGSLMLEGDGTTGGEPSPSAGTPKGDTTAGEEAAFE